MAIIIEALPTFHLGWHHGRASYPDGDIRTLHLGWIAILHIHGSLTDLLQRWKQVADEGVERRVEMWKTAETINADGEGE